MGTIRASGLAILATVVLGQGTARAQQTMPIGAAPAVPPPGSAGEAGSEGLSLLGIRINGRDLDGTTLLAVRGNDRLVPLADLRDWHLRVPATGIVTIEGQAFVPLVALRGVTARIDAARQVLVLDAAVDAFETTALSGDIAAAPSSEAVTTAFLNYDVALEHGAGRSVVGAQATMGASGRLGLVANTLTIGRTLGGTGVVRLDTYALHDDPGGLTRLSIGDGLTRGSAWAPPVRFGGVRFGTDFSLQPGFLAFPTPLFRGQAALPSNVEIYVDDVLRYQSRVDPGPFTLDRLPLVSGAGRVALQVRDALGVEQRLLSTYYVSTQLLRAGLSDYSAELGAERRNYGLRSFDYARPFAAGTYRRGLNRIVTLETRGEFARGVQALGGGGALALAPFGEVAASLVGSHDRDRAGLLYRVSAARIATRWSFALTYQHASRGFVELGLARRDDRPLQLVQASGGTSLPRLGSLNASYALVRRADGLSTRVAQLNYNHRVGRGGTLNAFLLRTAGSIGSGRVTAGISLSMALGRRTSGFAQIATDDQRIELQRNVPDDRGWGYRLVAGRGANAQQQANLDYRGRAIELSAQAVRFRGALSERLLASGGLVLADRSLLATRRLEDGFAIVDVPHMANVRVLQDNREVTRTDRHGVAIVTRLRPYEANRIAVAPDDIHLDATIGRDAQQVVPRYLGGVIVRFDVGGGHAGMVIVVREDGRPLEAGTPVTMPGKAQTFYSGMQGEVFVDDLAAGLVLQVARAGGACRVVVPPFRAGDILPTIGPLPCLAPGR